MLCAVAIKFYDPDTMRWQFGALRVEIEAPPAFDGAGSARAASRAVNERWPWVLVLRVEIPNRHLGADARAFTPPFDEEEQRYYRRILDGACTGFDVAKLKAQIAADAKQESA